MNITLLGTGTPAPLADRAASGYVVKLDNTTIAFDCGPCSHARLIEAGIELTTIDHTFITHWHYDHFADLPPLVLRRWDQGAGRIGEIKLYGPRPIKRIVGQLFSARGVFGPDIAARTHNPMSVGVYEARGGRVPRKGPRPIITELRDGSQVTGQGWTVSALEVPHGQPQLRCLAYRLDAAGASLVYTGDTGPCEKLIPFARDADVMIHMCHFLAGSALNEGMATRCSDHLTAARHAHDARVRTLVLTHITGQLDTNGVRERMLHEVAQVFHGTVIFGRDLMRIDARRLRRAAKPV